MTPDVLRTAPLSGLLIDEWVEVGAEPHETTAITFQTDPPNACAPQAVLLAVPPVPGKPWTGGTLVRVLSRRWSWPSCAPSTPRRWASSAHYLPALHFGFNVAGRRRVTDFEPLS